MILKYVVTVFIISSLISCPATAKKAVSKSPAKVVKQLSEFDSLKMHMRSKTDEFSGVKFIEDKTTPRYINSKDHAFYIYISQIEEDYNIRLVCGFRNRDWIFTNRILIKTDYGVHSVPFNEYTDIERKAGYPYVVEWVDVLYDNYKCIKEICNSKKVQIRFSGNHYALDKVITLEEKNAIKRVFRLKELFDEKVTKSEVTNPDKPD